MNDEKLYPAPSLMHTANVFLPGSLGPVRREVMLSEDVQDLVDRLSHAVHERDQLATAIANAGIAAGMIHANMAIDGPMLLQIAENLGKPDEDGERYRAMRDCEWPGGCQQVGIVHRDNEANWLHGEEADRAVDKARAPSPEPEPSPPSKPEDRICFKEDCWYCEGTGWHEGKLCYGDDIPF